MGVGIFQRVVQYSVVQKITELVGNHNFHHPQIANFVKYMDFNKFIKNKRKSVTQSLVKGDYIVMRCSLPYEVPSQVRFL